MTASLDPVDIGGAMKKTLFVTCGEGFVARNLLRTGLLEKLAKHDDVRVVVLTPGAKDQAFVDEFNNTSATFVDFPENPRRHWREDLFNTLHSQLIFTETSHIKLMDRINKNRFNLIKYCLRRGNAFLFGRFGGIKRGLCWLDRIILPDRANSHVFDKFCPSLVFSTNIMVRRDFDVLKQALKRKIKTIGMPRSWDNLVKDIPMRVRPHKLIVWNELMKEQAITYQQFREEDIFVAGIPQFDLYAEKNRFSSRDVFFRTIGADPSKPLILFAGCGRWTPNDPDIVRILSGFVEKGLLEKDCQILVRPHFVWKDYIKPLTDLAGLPGIIVDNKWNRSSAFPDAWDPKEEDMLRLADSLYHADMLITSFSTMVIDMAYFDKPIINIAFDGFEKKTPRESMVRWYGTRYYKDVLECNGTVLAQSADELLNAINRYLSDPSLEKEGREKIRRRFCYRTDGKATKRIADFLLQQLENQELNSARRTDIM